MKYTIETRINGNIKEAKESYKLYLKGIEKRKNFYWDIIDCCEFYGNKLAIKHLTGVGVFESTIISAFIDYKREDLYEIKTILIKQNYELC